MIVLQGWMITDNMDLPQFHNKATWSIIHVRVHIYISSVFLGSELFPLISPNVSYEVIK